MKNQAQELVNIFGRLFCDPRQKKLFLEARERELGTQPCSQFEAHEYLNGLRSLTLEQQEQTHEIVELAANA